MRFRLFFPSFFALTIASQLEAKPVPDINSLNFQGMQALKATVDSSDAKHVHYARGLSDESWQEIFHIFQTALKIHPGAEETRQNLMVAHNDYALYLVHERKFPQALQEFHVGLFIQYDLTTEANMAVVMRAIGKDPKSFSERVAMGDKAKTDKDIFSEIIEYRAALKIKDDQAVEKKLQKAILHLNRTQKVLFLPELKCEFVSY